ncbi:hypothetical protein B0H11DRAFT_1929038 [Mycena galericulata]|nr:hypothetical protein B0H11DRAFT_1929038 [Mycena galericulata]
MPEYRQLFPWCLFLAFLLLPIIFLPSWLLSPPVPFIDVFQTSHTTFYHEKLKLYTGSTRNLSFIAAVLHALWQRLLDHFLFLTDLSLTVINPVSTIKVQCYGSVGQHGAWVGSTAGEEIGDEVQRADDAEVIQSGCAGSDRGRWGKPEARGACGYPEAGAGADRFCRDNRLVRLGLGLAAPPFFLGVVLVPEKRSRLCGGTRLQGCVRQMSINIFSVFHDVLLHRPRPKSVNPLHTSIDKGCRKQRVRGEPKVKDGKKVA